MRIKKRRKSSRFAGSQTAKRGKKARTRGSGNQGGKGWAGTGKRGDQKKTLVIKLSGGNNYFGKSKTLRRGNVSPKLEVINISDIERVIDFLIKKGLAKEAKGVYEIDYTGYKILGDGDIKLKLNIKASSASQSAIEKVKKAGGEIIINQKTLNKKILKGEKTKEKVKEQDKKKVVSKVKK